MSKWKPNKISAHQRGTVVSPLAAAENFLRRRQWREVDELLTPLINRMPNNRELWAILGDARTHLDDKRRLWEVSEAMLRLEPNEPDNWFNAVNVAMMNQMVFTALHYAHEFLRRFPDNANASTIRKDQALLESMVADLRHSEPTAADGTNLDFMELEQVTLIMSMGDFQTGERITRRTIQRSPRLVAPKNNLALIYSAQGKLEAARTLAESVLSSQPTNVHGLANLIEILVRQGKRAEAEQVAARLVQLPLTDDALLKQIQALTLLCNDQTIVDLFEQVNASEIKNNVPSLYPTLFHLAAVAYAYLGNEPRAKQLWQQALKGDPDNGLIKANLDNLRLPANKRTKAFPFTLINWIPQHWIEELLKVAERGQRSPDAIKTHLNKFLKANPGLETLLPTLFERGDPAGREFALRVAGMAQLPLLRDFALSENGSDQDRMNAAQEADNLGMFTPGELIPLFIKGGRKQIMLMNYEITDEPDPSKRPPALQKLLETTHAALSSGAFVEGEALAREGIALAPDEPSLWNYLAVSLEAQKKDAEYETVTRHVVELFPDYFFARIGMARVLVRHGEMQAARDMLQPLIAKRKLHFSEFNALAVAHIELFVAEKEYQGARYWLDMWEQVSPDDPGIARYRRKLLSKG